jgi:hypothetical protein
MTDEREILEQVARGELSPEDAAVLLDDAPPGEAERGAPADLGDASDAHDGLFGSASAWSTLGRAFSSSGLLHDSEPDEAAAPTAPLFPDAEVTTLHLIGAFRNAVVVGDPTVRTVTVDGPHRARLEGSTLIIDGDDENGEGFRIETRRGIRRGRHFRIGVDNPRPIPLSLRANPTLALIAEVAAGTLKIHEMRGPLTAEVAAGALSITGATGPLDLSTAAGPIKVQGRITTGSHRIRCEAGAVKVILDPSSDVRIRARASLGKVILPGVSGPSGFAIGSSQSESIIGDGTATLSIECAVGGVKVVVGDGDDR